MGTSLKFFSLALFLLSFAAIQPVNAMSDEAFKGLEKEAQNISTRYATAKKCGLQRTAKKLFDMFGKTASLCEPRETQLIKLERILASAKAKGKCNDLDKVEQDVLNALNFMNFHYAALDLNFALGGNDVCGEYFIELNNLREINSRP